MNETLTSRTLLLAVMSVLMAACGAGEISEVQLPVKGSQGP